MFFKKEEIIEGKPPETVYANRLTVYFHDGSYKYIQMDNWKYGNRCLVRPWRDFYKWIFGREAQYFRLRFKNGEYCIKRNEIRNFDVEIIERPPKGS